MSHSFGFFVVGLSSIVFVLSALLPISSIFWGSSTGGGGASANLDFLFFDAWGDDFSVSGNGGV